MSKIDKLGIDSPCTADWNKMRGNDRVRYCEECRRYVHDFSLLPRRQVEEMMAASPDRICARLTYNNDNSLVFLDSRTSSRSEGHRASLVAAAIMTAMMGISAGGALPVIAAPPAALIVVQGELKKDAKDKNTEGLTASITGTVIEQSGVIVARVPLMLVNEKSGKARTLTSDNDGRFRFSNLQSGRYTIEIKVSNFAPFTSQKIYVQQGQEQVLNINLEPKVVVMGVIGSPVLSLRELYDQSHVIAIVRAGKSKKVKKEGAGSVFRTEFHIKESLKGEAESTVYMQHTSYDDEEGLRPDDNLLVFLKHSMPEKGKPSHNDYELVDRNYGLKKLPESEIGIYAARLRDLEGIMQADKPDPKAIVEWLVRCIEDPATRWEGAIELEWSFDEIEYDQDEGGEVDKSETEDSLNNSEEEDVEDDIASQSAEISEKEQDREIQLASLLTSDQKKRLSSVLFNGEMDINSRLLIRIVRHWDSEKLIPFLIERLRRNEEKPLLWSQSIVAALSELIDDERVSESAEEFINKALYEDLQNELDEEEKEEIVRTHSEAQRHRSMLLKNFLNAVEHSLEKREK